MSPDVVKDGPSIGIEFETSLCVFDSTEELIRLHKQYLICDQNINCLTPKCKKGWSISLEYDTGLPRCLNIIEGQIGVAYSDKDEFNKNQLKKQIKSFSCFFKSIVDKQSININGIEYPIIQRNNEINCKDLPEKIKLKDIYGKPQITFGIKIEYIYTLYNYIKDKLDKIYKKFLKEIFKQLAHYTIFLFYYYLLYLNLLLNYLYFHLVTY